MSEDVDGEDDENVNIDIADVSLKKKKTLVVNLENGESNVRIWSSFVVCVVVAVAIIR